MDSSSEQERTRDTSAIGISQGCLFALLSTAVTCFLLFINGGLVSALCQAFGDLAPIWMQNPRSMQFIMFVGPVVFVIVQWMMIDYVMRRLSRGIKEKC